MSAAQTDPDAAARRVLDHRASACTSSGTWPRCWVRLVGTAIDPTKFGLDAAFPAGFVAMLWPLLRDRRGRLAAALRRGDLREPDPVPAGRRADPVRVGGRARRGSPVSWTLVLLLGAGAFGFKVLGLIVVGDRSAAARARALPRADPGSPDRGDRRARHVRPRRSAPADRRRVPRGRLGGAALVAPGAVHPGRDRRRRGDRRGPRPR